MPRAEIRRRRANQNDEEAGSRTETIADFEDRKKVTSELNQALRPHQAGGGGVSSIPFLPMLGVMLLYSVLHSGVFHSSTIALAVGVVSAIVTQILAGKSNPARAKLASMIAAAFSVLIVSSVLSMVVQK